jgi:predicted DNA-binding protein (MmcQ/YjbR family)
VQLDDLVDYCLAKPGAAREEPWPEVIAIKVGGKTFAFISMDGVTVALKCGRTAEDAREPRDQYPEDVVEMSYLARYGWNRFTVGRGVPDEEIFDAIDYSYDDVVGRLPKSKRPAVTS